MKTISKKELTTICGGFGPIYCFNPNVLREIIKRYFRRTPPINPSPPSYNS